MRNVKEFRDLIKGFFKSHAQIHTVKSGNQFEFNADKKIKYPIAHIEYINTRNSDDTSTVNFLINVADLYEPNLVDSEEDIYSNTEQICQDCLTHFDNVDDIFTVNNNANIDPWNNGHTDRLRGCVFTLSFTQTRESNDCQTPTRMSLLTPLVPLNAFSPPFTLTFD